MNMNKKRKSIICFTTVMAAAAVLGGIFWYGNQRPSKAEKADWAKIQKTYPKEVQEAKNGQYPNLNVIEMNPDFNGIEELYQIDLEANWDYKENTPKENLQQLKNIIHDFYGDSFELPPIQVTYFLSEDNYKEVSMDEFEQMISKGTEKILPYILLFGDGRTEGKKGFLQLDSSMTSLWFSKGEIPETFPMYSYDIKKVYNLAVNRDGLEDKIQLQDGEITIAEAAAFIENYLNNELPYEKNPDFVYQVAEVRVLDVEGQDALGFCVRKTYRNIPFDYVDGSTDNEFTSPYWDDRGELCMIKTNEIDNICGLGGDTFSIIEAPEPINQAVSLEDALHAVSDEIGRNSVYDIYGVELVYQFIQEEPKEDAADAPARYNGRLKWKIIGKNQNDDKDTLFYVDLETGAVASRFKPEYGE